jgi:hypothetical protein
MNGIPQIKVAAGATAVSQEERFTAPRPAFNAPKDESVTTPQARDNTPSLSLAARAKLNGNEALAKKIAEAQEKANEAMARARGEKPATTKQRVTKGKKQKTEASTIIPVEFHPEDVCDEATFIRRTNSGDYHTPEMKRLFYANGGAEYLKSGLSYANAFSNLRQSKMKVLREKKE